MISIGSLKRDWAFYITKELVGFVLQIYSTECGGCSAALFVCF